MPLRIEIIDAALMRLGAEPIGDETASGADTHIAIYNSVVHALLASNPWSFNTVTRQLPRLSAAPMHNWLYQFELPPDMLGAPRCAFDRIDSKVPLTDWEICDGTLQTDAAEVWLRFDRQPEPGRWPGVFVELVTVAVMAELALSVREDAVLRDRLLRDAYGTPSDMRMGGLMGQALVLDSQGKPSPVIAMGRNPLIAARYGR